MEIPKALEMYKGLPRSIYVLFFARIVNTMGAFVRPFLAIFLTNNLNINEGLAGLIVTIAIGVYLPGSIFGGYLTDKKGRKNILIIFSLIAAICFIPCAFLGNSLIIPVLLIMSDFFLAAAEPASSSMVADLTNEKNRKASFSLLYLGINIGFSVGPLIAGFLYNNYIEWIFLGDAFTTFISIFLIYRYVGETIPDIATAQIDESSDERPEHGSTLQVLLRRPFLMGAAFITMFLTFVMGQSHFALPLQLNNIFGIDSGPSLFGVLMSVNGIVVVAMTVFLISLTKAFKPIVNMGISAILYGIGYGILYLTNMFEFYIISTVIWTLGEILMATNFGVYIANHTPMTHRGRFNAIINTIVGMGHVVGPVLMGVYIEALSLHLVWPMIFAIGMITAVMYAILYKIESRKKIEPIIIEPINSS